MSVPNREQTSCRNPFSGEASLSFTAEACRDVINASVQPICPAPSGRIIRANAVIRSICPCREVAVFIILTGTDAEGKEKCCGSRTFRLPPQPEGACTDFYLHDILFAVPDETCCHPRSFHLRVIAHYTSCEPECCLTGTAVPD